MRPKIGATLTRPIHFFPSSRLVILALVLLVAGCGGLRVQDDFAALRSSGQLKLGLWRPPAAESLAPVDPLLAEQGQLEDFALHLGLSAKIVPFGDLESMLEALESGQIDLAAPHIAPQTGPRD